MHIQPMSNKINGLKGCGFLNRQQTHACWRCGTGTGQSTQLRQADDQDSGTATTHNLADDALEYQLLDRRNLLQFLGLTESSTIPDGKTIWLFRDRLAQARLGTRLSERVRRQLLAYGYLARRGQIIEASLVRAQVQRNKREEVAGRRKPALEHWRRGRTVRIS